MKSILFVLSTPAALLCNSMAALADETQPFTLAQAKDVIRDVQRLVSPNGVQEQLEIPVGGINQWISVRGRDRRNPSWLPGVHVPFKKFVWFENSAQMISTEEPGRVLVHLAEDVRPLAGSDLPADQ